MPQIVTNLWFDAEGEEAAAFCCPVFPRPSVTRVLRCGGGPREAGTVTTVELTLDGARRTAINGARRPRPGAGAPCDRGDAGMRELDLAAIRAAADEEPGTA